MEIIVPSGVAEETLLGPFFILYVNDVPINMQKKLWTIDTADNTVVILREYSWSATHDKINVYLSKAANLGYILTTI